jgi:hypothetical protein
MTTDRVTVSLPTEVRQAAQKLADAAGAPFSTVVSEALQVWMRSRLLEAWLMDYEVEHGAFDEDELQALAAESGIPYVPPGLGVPAA